MPSIRKVKKRLKRQLRYAGEVKRMLSHEHYLQRTMKSLMKVVAMREWIEYLEQELSNLKESERKSKTFAFKNLKRKK